MPDPSIGVPTDPSEPPGRRVVRVIGLPLLVAFATAGCIAGGVAGGPLGALAGAGAAVLGTGAVVGGILGVILLVQVLASTRGGATIPGDAYVGFSVDVNLGGDPATTASRARAIALGLSNAEVVREDADGIELRADGRRFGAKARHTITLRFEGPMVHARVRHQDPNRPLDFGSTARQAEALRSALEQAAQPLADVERELGSVRPRARERSSE